MCEEGGGGGMEEEERVEEGLVEVEERLVEERLGEAMSLMLAIGDGVEECKEVEVIFKVIVIIIIIICNYYYY